MRARYAFAAAALITLAGCEQFEGAAEKAVRARMRDPASVEFKDVRPCAVDGKITVGQFNAKNGFGAYDGFETFFYESGQGVAFSDHPLIAAWRKRCLGVEVAS